jgi:hypothetical protein
MKTLVGHRVGTGATILVAAFVMCAPAGAATLKPFHNYDGVRNDHWEAVYVAGAEANHVTLGGMASIRENAPKLSGQGGSVYVLRDPNVPISAPPFEPPYVDTDPTHLVNALLRVQYGETPVMPFRTSFNCMAPHGRGQGLCVAIPGTWCNDGGCFTREDAHFEVADLSLGAGNDSATLLPGSSHVSVLSGAGNDTLDTRNGAPDDIDCGDGVDSVAAEWADNVAADCETVTRGRP